ncbi:MAG: SPOR domain-containing protein, partial [Alphaproteobacteria bacterium]|nr:SPOR domain-containing protein [Alphaproteobacteria bacterium]
RPQPASGAAPPTRLLPSTDGRAPASPAAASAAGASSAPRGAGATAPGFAVQVGAFLTGSHATRLAEDLQKRGHDARVVVETDTSGRPWHIVRVGRFTDRYTALGAANRLKSAEGVPTMVVTELLSGPALR